MKTAEELFNAWQDLGEQVKAMGHIVQNGSENVTLKEAWQWYTDHLELRKRYDNLADNTWEAVNVK